MLIHYAQETSQMGIHFENIEIIPHLWLDEILIQRAFFNLLINAVKYGKKKSIIRIVGRQSQTGYNIDVINEGLGVDADEESLIFLAGYRSPRVRHLRIGLGLGLPIARACVEKCGGNLYLLARRNPTVFSVFFPRELTRKPQSQDYIK
jgi:signal transduction histidine kinase